MCLWRVVVAGGGAAGGAVRRHDAPYAAPGRGVGGGGRLAAAAGSAASRASGVAGTVGGRGSAPAPGLAGEASQHRPHRRRRRRLGQTFTVAASCLHRGRPPGVRTRSSSIFKPGFRSSRYLHHTCFPADCVGAWIRICVVAYLRSKHACPHRVTAVSWTTSDYKWRFFRHWVSHNSLYWLVFIKLA